MSDTEMVASSQAPQANGGMSQADVDFLMCCLRNTTGGSIQVDTQRVAQLLNYKNPRSVSNKVSNIKKKYDLPFGASSRTAEEMASLNTGKHGKGDASPKKASEANGDNEPAVPTTPSKNRVTKAKATPKPRTTKKTPAKRYKKVVSEDEDDELADLKEEDLESTKQEDEE
ncbi:hypothetical protein DID88_006036 [Monilinia fructigena]|uniref:Uncharacterized protein n=1 Tax=Monilinia fructigena TaxID=38457 RepID=A0A395J1I5_9HELO|nr:hypothetical protein DID88_006036 [Monilinia fructigena]